MILPQTGLGQHGGRLDVLSIDEEDVLSKVRLIVSGLRAKDDAIGLEPVRKAVTESGATIVLENPGSGAIELRLGRVRFVLRSVPEGIEISFPIGET